MAEGSEWPAEFSGMSHGLFRGCLSFANDIRGFNMDIIMRRKLRFSECKDGTALLLHFSSEKVGNETSRHALLAFLGVFSVVV